MLKTTADNISQQNTAIVTKLDNLLASNTTLKTTADNLSQLNTAIATTIQQSSAKNDEKPTQVSKKFTEPSQLVRNVQTPGRETDAITEEVSIFVCLREVQACAAYGLRIIHFSKRANDKGDLRKLGSQSGQLKSLLLFYYIFSSTD